MKVWKTERIVYFKLNDSVCTAKVPLSYEFGENIEIKLSVGDMYFFNTETDENMLFG